MNSTKNEIRIQELVEDVESLFDAFSDLTPYEVGCRMIASSVRTLLSCASDEITAMKAVMASIEIGITEFQESIQE